MTRSVLAVGAHPDDIELGCGATLLAHQHRGDRLALLVMTTGEQGPQDATSRIAEQQEAAEMLGAELYWGSFADGAVPDDGRAVQCIDEVIARTGADVLYTHAPGDTHQDHRATSAASIAAARRLARVLCYESPTSTGLRADLFVDASGLVDRKLELIRAHLSQVLKNGLVDLEAVEALARMRGFEGRLRHAEAFEVVRFAWDLGDAHLDRREAELAVETATP